MSLFSTFEAVEILKRDAQIASLTVEIERLRFALIQMMPDYAAFIEDAVDHGADETWVEECRQIAAYARAALQPEEPK